MEMFGIGSKAVLEEQKSLSLLWGLAKPMVWNKYFVIILFLRYLQIIVHQLNLMVVMIKI